MPFSSLSEIQSRLDAGETTAVEVAQLYLDRIAAHNEELNAFVHIDPKHVLAQAEASDKFRAAHPARPLEGLPIAVKDIFLYSGWSNPLLFEDSGRFSCAL